MYYIIKDNNKVNQYVIMQRTPYGYDKEVKSYSSKKTAEYHLDRLMFLSLCMGINL